MLKHILFDFDGTLADSGDIGLQIVNELSEKYKFRRFTREELVLLNHKPIKQRLKEVGIPFYRMPTLIVEALARYKQLISSLNAFDGIRELLTGLKAHDYQLSIVSSNSVDNIEYFIKNHNLDYFDNVISVNNLFGKHKAISNHMKKFKLQKDEIIYVGDELRDIESCKKIPIKVIAVLWGYDALDLLESGKPDYICNSPDDILKIAKELK